MPFEALAETLLQAGIAPRRVLRYRAELEDHLAQLIEAQHAVGYEGEDADLRARALLGDDAELAEPWLANPRLKCWTARAPWTVFGLAVPVFILLAYVGPVLLMVALAKFNGFTGHEKPFWYRETTQAIAMAANLALPFLLGAALASLARRQRLSLWWPLLGAVLIAAIAMQIHVVFAAEGHRDSISLGALIWYQKIRQLHAAFDAPLMLIQAVLALAPVGILWAAQRPFHRRG